MTKKKNDFNKKIQELKIHANIRKAFESVERNIFFEEFFRDKCPGFDPIPIGFGEQSDDVSLLAEMFNILSPKKSWNLLEVGTGSGYSTALLSTMVKKIVTIELHEQLAVEAKKRLINNGYFNIKFMAGDCSELDDTAGLFDAAIIYSGCTHSPYSVLNLIKPGGAAVFPMGPPHMQQLTLFKNIVRDTETDPFERYTFFRTCQVPSIKGAYGNTSPGIDIIAEME
ncbi:MAG TPA: methyltransferase domain-containing protein [Spirochaetota bacterium]|nr:methyltransferase domain-containing protein [Spirochaetota bacterium]HPJ36548.1 methyltransferase domain-containing protein [Spirochaetota bacterium]